MRKHIFLIIIYAAVLTGCASTTITDFHDPAYKNVQFKHILVMSPDLDLQAARYLQEQTCKAMRFYRETKCSTWLSLFIPTREYTPQQRGVIIKQAGIDAFLHYHQTRRETGIEGQPQISAFNYYEQFSDIGPSTAFGSGTGVGLSGPSFTNTKTYGFEIALVDVSNYKKAWIAGATTYSKGSNESTDESTLWHMSGEVVGKLGETKLIK